MIQATELRIGNRVLNKSLYFDSYNEVTVTSFSIKDCELWPQGYSPIQITEEWARRFGFKWSERMGEFSMHPIYIINLDGDLTVFLQETPVKNIQYVHQLQNLYYAITGEELIINNLTIK